MHNGYFKKTSCVVLLKESVFLMPSLRDVMLPSGRHNKFPQKAIHKMCRCLLFEVKFWCNKILYFLNYFQLTVILF